ncbi:hypothetical protein EC973_000317 [Apophysomyces ossiformis]|uniref:Uncharacterized protein n=1 Tax=Apophysomyces ossiformis TaxID=679940 RepID=A0A8H7EQ38_9FUNG|nr:hypothetical protein EC973_000317 [Apophysomyces ossiformis]
MSRTSRFTLLFALALLFCGMVLAQEATGKDCETSVCVAPGSGGKDPHTSDTTSASATGASGSASSGSLSASATATASGSVTTHKSHEPHGTTVSGSLSSGTAAPTSTSGGVAPSSGAPASSTLPPAASSSTGNTQGPSPPPPAVTTPRSAANTNSMSLYTLSFTVFVATMAFLL